MTADGHDAPADVRELGRGRLLLRLPYSSGRERRRLRSAVEGKLRGTGLRVVTRSFGQEMWVALEISGRCLERRAQPRAPIPDDRRRAEAVARRERGDLEAVRELVSVVRRLRAELERAKEPGP
jgi:hypothetical protein